jgi:hypothetical protein
MKQSTKLTYATDSKVNGHYMTYSTDSEATGYSIICCILLIRWLNKILSAVEAASTVFKSLF